MVHVLVHHKVADYNRWKATFDSDLTARKRAGEIGVRVFHNADDAHDIFTAFGLGERRRGAQIYELQRTSRPHAASGSAGRS